MQLSTQVFGHSPNFGNWFAIFEWALNCKPAHRSLCAGVFEKYINNTSATNHSSPLFLSPPFKNRKERATYPLKYEKPSLTALMFVPEKESTSLSCRHTSESSIILSFFRKTHTQYTCVSKCKNSALWDYVCPVEKYINSSTSEHFSPLPFSFILGNPLSPGHEQKANGQDICSALSLLDLF
jgi:hypothetical protein